MNWILVFTTVFFCAAWAIETHTSYTLRKECRTYLGELALWKGTAAAEAQTFRTCDLTKSQSWSHAEVEEVGPPAFILEQEQGQTQGGNETGLHVVWPIDENCPYYSQSVRRVE